MSDTLVDPFIGNSEFLTSLYDAYLTNPAKFDPAWQQFFRQIEGDNASVHLSKAPSDLRIANLIQSYRRYGHLFAVMNPIAMQPTMEPTQLSLETLGFNSNELTQNFPTLGLLPSHEASLKEIIDFLRSVYCGSVGIEYIDLEPPELVQWIQSTIEESGFKSHLSFDEKKRVLEFLNKSELFESFLHTKYVGQKRFSLEGAETLIPMLAAMIDRGAILGMKELVLGMAHRGRLNVLSNIMYKSYADIFSEFDGAFISDSFEGTGDVKYHKGYFSAILSSHGYKIKISLTPNPSHLEFVDPVVEGQVRAKQFHLNDETERQAVIPVLIHGDAALTGQGVVYETLQLYDLPGYCTGGTIHVVINNQIGFTTLPKDARSTLYCTDIAKTFNAPVFHVNAEDPEACVYTAYLAMEIRQKFHCDVFIDLNCYRKYGHNEGDEPAFTQPLEYQLIRKKKSIREIYRDSLIQQGVLEKEIAESLQADFKTSLQKALEAHGLLKPYEISIKNDGNTDEKILLTAIETGVPLDTLQEVTKRFTSVPSDFQIHPKLKNLVHDRLEMVMGEGKEKPIDWGMGEFLAYATLLWEGTNIRLSGQDVCRGTFSHRHALWMNQAEGKAYYPLCHLKEGQGRFEIVNSSLSEIAALGFEYGYSLASLDSLVIWEAQFGDFANGAQVIIDQFIVSGEQKWGQKSGLILLLPHGYEGQGPEHSSARIERFLILAGHHNMLIVNPTTPAQMFHLLRRHRLLSIRKPLIVFTPKGLLRYPLCVNSIHDFTEGSFQEIIDDPSSPSDVQRVVFCSGRIYYDLLAEREKQGHDSLAIIRIEQIYPLHLEKIKALISKYEGFTEFFWVQEEPSNMGAWNFIRPYLEELINNDNVKFSYAGRKCSASPATGSHAMHEKEHNEIMDSVFSRH